MFITLPLNFEQFNVISMVDKSIDREKLLSICRVDMLLFYLLGVIVAIEMLKFDVQSSSSSLLLSQH